MSANGSKHNPNHAGAEQLSQHEFQRQYALAQECLTNEWDTNPRWKGVERPYTAADVLRLRGSIHVEHTLARLGAERLWELLTTEPYVNALGAMSGNQAVQQVQAGLKAIYVSGWQVAADANNAGTMYPDQSLYPADSVPNLCRRINNALQRADQIHYSEGKVAPGQTWFAPLVADAEAGFGGTLNAFELMKGMIEAGAACVHFEDQLSSAKKCGHLGGKVLVSTTEAIQKLFAARLAADVMGVSTLIMARTDADSAHLLTSDIDPRDREFCTGERTSEGFFRIRGGIQSAIARGLAYAPYADLIWCETSHPDLEEARQFAQAIHAQFPRKMLAYNCSPSFNWRKNIDEATIARFQPELARMGYKFQFVTLAGFHALNLSMFELARGYKQTGMTAYSRLQEKEFSRETQYGYEAVKHQRFVGTGYFDQVQQVITSGLASTIALTESTEAHQFAERKPLVHPEHGPDAACQPILGDCPHTPVKIESAFTEPGPEEMLLPSGD
ncbi:MAG TPA: isocitrate lyase [Verrucomicrobiae bacterium]|jgi:isocitrate lyase|nr:isocitrate lyase [Verrucomicrobiae bacterium]